MKHKITVEVDLADIINDTYYKSSGEEDLMELIKGIDSRVADTSFTLAVIEMFMDSLRDDDPEVEKDIREIVDNVFKQ